MVPFLRGGRLPSRAEAWGQLPHAGQRWRGRGCARLGGRQAASYLPHVDPCVLRVCRSGTCVCLLSALEQRLSVSEEEGGDFPGGAAAAESLICLQAPA